jgi:iron complex transport system substrate-binding protein
VLCLNPQDLGDVWRDILWVGEQTRRGRAAEALLEKIGERLARLEASVAQTSERPRVAFLEWLQPFYVGGHWVPEMIALGGGDDVLGRVHTPSFRVTLEEIVVAAPDIILVSPCGYSAQQARDEYHAMSHSEEWSALPAVQCGRVYALEANSYFSRPGPRLITGIEALAKIFLHSSSATTPSRPHRLRLILSRCRPLPTLVILRTSDEDVRRISASSPRNPVSDVHRTPVQKGY